VRLVRRRLKRQGLRARVPPPPRLRAGSGRGVAAVLRRLEPTCLEKALVEQAWMAANGIPRDVVIGVLPGGMKDGPAHAWVDGTDTLSPSQYLELHRLPPPAGRLRAS
jgi:Transglutaminase-like superfamily